MQEISIYGGYPVLDQTWDPNDWSFEDVAGRVRAQLFHWPAIIGSLVTIDDKNSSNHVLQVDLQYSISLHDSHLSRFLKIRNSMFYFLFLLELPVRFMTKSLI